MQVEHVTSMPEALTSCLTALGKGREGQTGRWMDRGRDRPREGRREGWMDGWTKGRLDSRKEGETGSLWNVVFHIHEGNNLQVRIIHPLKHFPRLR